MQEELEEKPRRSKHRQEKKQRPAGRTARFEDGQGAKLPGLNKRVRRVGWDEDEDDGTLGYHVR